MENFKISIVNKICLLQLQPLQVVLQQYLLSKQHKILFSKLKKNNLYQLIKLQNHLMIMKDLFFHHLFVGHQNYLHNYRFHLSLIFS